MPAKTLTPIMVTTEKRGVFFGYTDNLPAAKKALERPDGAARAVTLKESRCAVQWRGIKSFMALASDGPGPECRISPASPEFTPNFLTSIAVCSEKAAKAWESAPWRG